MAGRTWIRALRWVIVAGSLAIAAVLIYRHDYVLGLLIAGLALVRVVYLVAIMRRPSARRSLYGAGPWSGTGVRTFGQVHGAEHAGTLQGRGVLAGLARQEFGVAARVIGIDGIQMRRAFDEGRSIAELAARSRSAARADRERHGERRDEHDRPACGPRSDISSNRRCR